MTVERYIRIFAGLFILISLALGKELVEGEQCLDSASDVSELLNLVT